MRRADWHQTSYFDNEGNLLRIQTHYAGTDEWYNATNSAVVLSRPFNGTIEYDARTGQQTLRGLGTQITVPGYGTVLMQAGHWFQYPDGRFVGNNTVLDPKDTAQLCSLLAGQ